MVEINTRKNHNKTVKHADTKRDLGLQSLGILC